MFQFDIDFNVKMQYYAISQLRQNTDYLAFCEIIGNDFNNIKTVSQYLLNTLDIDKASGIWLDYIGWLVGTTREYFDITDYFCVNASHINASKYFYFPSQTIGSEDTLNDDLFRKRIKAKVAYNTSRGTRNENNEIIKNFVNASRVIIERDNPMSLDITLYGPVITALATKANIEKLLGDGVGIHNLVIEGE